MRFVYGFLAAIILAILLYFGQNTYTYLKVRAEAGAYTYQYLAAPMEKGGPPRHQLLEELFAEQAKKPRPSK